MLVTPEKPVAVVLAAGKGTRMKSRYPKAVHPLLGKPMARYPIDLCRRLGIQRVVVVVGHEGEQVRAALGDDVEYVAQVEQRGTGDALLSASGILERYSGPLLVLQGDNVLLTDSAVAALLERHAGGASATLLTALLPDPGAYGRILRGDDGAVQAIVEARGATPEVLRISEINAGAYLFNSPELFQVLGQVAPDAVTGELYLTDVVRLLVERGDRVEGVVAEDATAAQSVNDRVQLAEASALLRRRLLREHMLNGVTIEDPDTTYIDAGVRIEADTVIRPMSILSGNTVIGAECEIGPNVRITDCRLGERVSVQFSVLAESEIGDDTRIGPFAQLRPGCKIGRAVKIGNFVELKKAVVGDQAAMGHLAYLGDVRIGERTNIGAGTITCNYDGRRKFPTEIGRDCFVGSHATLVAPVSLGEGSFVAAGSVVTEDVPEDALAIGRSRQTNKPEWAKKRRERE